MGMPKGASPMSVIANPLSLTAGSKATEWLDPVGMMLRNNPNMQKFDPLGGMLGAYPAQSSSLMTGAQLYGRRTAPTTSTASTQQAWNSRLYGNNAL